MLRTYVVCLDVTVCLFGTIVTQIIHQKKKLQFFLGPSGGGGGEDSMAYASFNPRPPSIDEQK